MYIYTIHILNGLSYISAHNPNYVCKCTSIYIYIYVYIYIIYIYTCYIHLTSHLNPTCAAPGDSFGFHGAPKTFDFRRAWHGKLADGRKWWVGGSQVTAILKWTWKSMGVSLLLMNVDVFTEVSEVLTFVGQRGIYHRNWSSEWSWYDLIQKMMDIPIAPLIYRILFIFASIGLVIYVPYKYWDIEAELDISSLRLIHSRIAIWNYMNELPIWGQVYQTKHKSIKKVVEKWWDHHATLQGNIFHHPKQSSTSTSQQSTVAPYCNRRVLLPVHRWLAP